MPKTEKVETIERITRLFQESNSFFITDYQGLNVPDMTNLRKKLRENKVKYLIAKNTLYKLAAKNVGQDKLDEHFTGPTAVAFASEDASLAAKVLYDSFKEKERPRIKAFVVDNSIYQPDDIKRLAELPPRDILLSMLVTAVESPLSSVVNAINGIFSELVRTIDTLGEKKKVQV